MGTGNNISARIMVMLDCILDTRLGTLAKIDPVRAAKVLESGKYHTRNCDIFEGYTKEEFDKAYASRDEETLALSTVTEGISGLAEIVKQLRRQAIDRPYHDKVDLEINIYPYQLDEETQNQICLAIGNWIQFADSIRLVNIPMEQLTPDFCVENYIGLFMYDYDNWWNHHVEAFKKRLMPSVYLWAPAIFFKEPPSQDELDQIKREKLPHPLEAMEMVASVLVTLQLIDIRFFSLPDPTVKMPKA